MHVNQVRDDRFLCCYMSKICMICENPENAHMIPISEEK